VTHGLFGYRHAAVAAFAAAFLALSCGPSGFDGDSEDARTREDLQGAVGEPPPIPIELTDSTRILGPFVGSSPVCRAHLGASPGDYPGPAPLLVEVGTPPRAPSRLEVFGSPQRVTCDRMAGLQQRGSLAAVVVSPAELDGALLGRLVDQGVELVLFDPGETGFDPGPLAERIARARDHARLGRRLIHFGWVLPEPTGWAELWQMPVEADLVVVPHAVARELGGADWSSMAGLIRASGRRAVLRSDPTREGFEDLARRSLLEGGGLWLTEEGESAEMMELVVFARQFQRTQDGGAADAAVYVSKRAWSEPGAGDYRRAVLDHARALDRAYVPFRFFVHGRELDPPLEHASWAEYLERVLVPASTLLPADEVDPQRWAGVEGVLFAGLEPDAEPPSPGIVPVFPPDTPPALARLGRDPRTNAQYLHLLAPSGGGIAEVSVPYHPGRGTPPLEVELWGVGEYEPRPVSGAVMANTGPQIGRLRVDVPIEAGWSVLATRPVVPSQPDQFRSRALEVTPCGGVCMAIRVPGFPANTGLELAIPEYFEDDDGVSADWEPPPYTWRWSNDLTSLSGAAHTGSLEVQFEAVAGVDSVQTTTTVRNLSDRPLRGLRALYCLRTTGGLLFPDSGQERTWVQVAGVPTVLPPVEEAGNCHYLEWRGADVPLTVLEGTAGQWALGIHFEHGEIVGGNALGNGVCIHGQPLFGDVPPGGTATAVGRIFVGVDGARSLWERIGRELGAFPPSYEFWVEPAPPSCAASAGSPVGG